MGNRMPKPSNKLMVDKLVEHSNPPIKTANVESVFRAVDRGMYYEIVEGVQVDPYDDEPWRSGNMHLSAPCIYARVVESLDLKPGLSFLNLGSGTGYLNTIVGLLIGPGGMNHGIEIHRDVVEYAYKRLDEFKRNTCAIYKYDFSEPVFVQGNCLNLNPDRKYDRIYLGAACLPEMEVFMKKLIHLNGGILVMPYENYLMRYIRSGEDTWTSEKLMFGVTFTMMIGQNDQIIDHGNNCNNNRKMIDMPPSTAKSLKELCRIAITQQLRHKTNLMNPNLLHSDNIDRRRHRRAMASLAMHRVEEQRQADAIRAHRAASAAAAAAASNHHSNSSVSFGAMNRSLAIRERNNRRCCQGIRGQHPVASLVTSSTQRSQAGRSSSQLPIGPTTSRSVANARANRPTSETVPTTGQQNRQQIEARMLTRSASRKLQTGQAAIQGNNPNSKSSSSSGSTIPAQAGTSDQADASIRSRPSSSRNTQAKFDRRDRNNDSNNNEFRASRGRNVGDGRHCRIVGNVSRDQDRLSNNCTQASPLVRQREQARSTHYHSPLFMFGGSNIAGRLMPGNREIFIPRQLPNNSGIGSSSLQSFTWGEISALSSRRLSRPNMPLKLCCPMRRHGREPDCVYKSLVPVWHQAADEDASDDDSNGNDYPMRLRSTMRRASSTDEANGDENLSSTSSAEFSWSTVSSSCDSSISQDSNISDDEENEHESADRDDLNDESDSEDEDEDEDDEEEDDDDDDDEDEQSSLGESWDSFLIDANGDQADSSDEDDDDYHDEHGTATIQARFNASIEFDVDQDDDRDVARFEELGLQLATVQDHDLPVSSRLRSSSIVRQSGERPTSNDRNLERAVIGTGSRTSAPSGGVVGGSAGSKTPGRHSCCRGAAHKIQCGDVVRRPGHPHESHLCRRHRVHRERGRGGGGGLLSGTARVVLRSRSSSRGSGGVNVDPPSRRKHRCSHLRTKRQAHMCRWHRRRQQQRRPICPLHEARQQQGTSSQATQTRAHNNLEPAAAPAARSSWLANMVDDSTQAKLRARLRNWLLGRFDSLATNDTPMFAGNLSERAESAATRPHRPESSAAAAAAAELGQSRPQASQARTRSNQPRATAATSPSTAKRKRQTSSSSGSSSSSASNSVLTFPLQSRLISSSVARKQPPTRRLRPAGLRASEVQCLCSRGKTSHLAASAATTSAADQQRDQRTALARRSIRFDALEAAASTARASNLPNSVSLMESPHTANDADEEDSAECDWERMDGSGAHRSCGKRHYCRKHSHLCRRHRRHHHHHHHHHRCNSSRHIPVSQRPEAVPIQLGSPPRVERLRELQTRRRVERRERRNSRRAAGSPGDSLFNQQVGLRGSNNDTATNRNAAQSSKGRKKKRRETECEKYRTHIMRYIRELPLPRELQGFLNFDRDF